MFDMDSRGSGSTRTLPLLSIQQGPRRSCILGRGCCYSNDQVGRNTRPCGPYSTWQRDLPDAKLCKCFARSVVVAVEPNEARSISVFIPSVVDRAGGFIGAGNLVSSCQIFRYVETSALTRLSEVLETVRA